MIKITSGTGEAIIFSMTSRIKLIKNRSVCERFLTAGLKRLERTPPLRFSYFKVRTVALEAVNSS